MRPSRRTRIALIVACCLAVPPNTLLGAGGVPPEDARAIAVDAYLYLYPLVAMDVTRRQATNIEAGRQPGRGPMNTFSHLPEFLPLLTNIEVRPNFDTLLSSAWLDVSREPVIVSVPDTSGRYYVLPVLDMWTDVVASIGWRTTGTRAGNFLIALASWKGVVPPGCVRIDVPTPYVWIRGRTRSDGPEDFVAVHAIQNAYTVTPLSEWGKPFGRVPHVTVDPALDMKTWPRIQVDTMLGEQFFSYALGLLRVHPPHVGDQPMLARMARIGLRIDCSFDVARLAPPAREALLAAPAAAQRLMTLKSPSVARLVHGWTMSTDTMGAYGTSYLKRAIVAQIALGAELPEDVMSPMNLGDYLGRPLDGRHRYRMHFEKAELPPVDAFWSVTLYDADGFAVPNALNRFVLSSSMPLHYNADGSLDLYFQHDTPGGALESNWLPAPEGPFNVALRLYAPKPDVRFGKWSPPCVVMVIARPKSTSGAVTTAAVLPSPGPRR